jgi:hypothetical protein
MGENKERCGACGHPVASHEPGVGCTERVPGMRDRIPGPCGCGAGVLTADILPFRRRSLSPPDDADSPPADM